MNIKTLLPDLNDLVAELAEDLLARTQQGDKIDAGLRDAFAHSVDPVGVRDIPPADEAVLVFSSGTTGLPKAVRHTHRSISHATPNRSVTCAIGSPSITTPRASRAPRPRSSLVKSRA